MIHSVHGWMKKVQDVTINACRYAIDIPYRWGPYRVTGLDEIVQMPHILIILWAQCNMPLEMLSRINSKDAPMQRRNVPHRVYL
jgi:hypothetical protein